MLDELKEQVYRANLALIENRLVTLTWGNVSGVDRSAGVMVIKPSGIDYRSMSPADMVAVSLDNGEPVDSQSLRPSSDAPTHLALYRAWSQIGGVAHTHSSRATTFAQAGRGIPCFGTTHADHFYGEVPVSRRLNEAEVAEDYELNTGRVIVERMKSLDVESMPAVLVADHGPFTWGPDANAAACNAIALEEVAAMAMGTMQINPSAMPLPRYIMDKHFRRKHGPDAYYGQQCRKDSF